MNDPIVIASRQTFEGTSSFSTPISIANWVDGSDWTLFLLVASSNNAVAFVAVQDSIDGFVDDIQVVATLDLQGQIVPPTDVAMSWRRRELGAFRCGQLNAEARISVTSASSGSAVTLSAEIK